jgi:hypothetical protein
LTLFKGRIDVEVDAFDQDEAVHIFNDCAEVIQVHGYVKTVIAPGKKLITEGSIADPEDEDGAAKS